MCGLYEWGSGGGGGGGMGGGNLRPPSPVIWLEAHRLHLLSGFSS